MMVQQITNCVLMPFRRYETLVDGKCKYKTRFLALMCVDCLDHASIDDL